MKTPEGTWNLLYSALREKDLETILSCFTEPAANKAVARYLDGTVIEQWDSFVRSNSLPIVPVSDSSLSNEKIFKFVSDSPNAKNRLIGKVVFRLVGGLWKINTSDFMSGIPEIQIR